MENKGLKIGIIGIGQAGGNIANEFSRLGYSTVAINTSATDLDMLDAIHKNNKLLINVGLQGAGKNPEVGRQALEEKIEDVFNFIQQVFDDTHKIFVCGGLGGGTGSGMTPLMCQILSEQGYDVGAIVTLPSNIEAPRVHVVALSAFEELSAVDNLSAIFVVDNQKSSEKLPQVGIKAKYKVINANIARLIDTINTYATKPSDIAFDAKDLETALSSRGCAIINQITIENIDDLKNEITLSAILKNALLNSVFANTDFAKTKAAVFLFELPEGAAYYLNDKSMQKMISELGTPFDVFFGVYENDDKKKMGTLTVMVSGLPFPEERLSQIQDFLEHNEQQFISLFEHSKNQKFKGKGQDFLSKFNTSKKTLDIKKEPGKQSTLEKILANKKKNKA